MAEFKKDLENFQEELRAYGADLFDELIPDNLKKILWDLRDNLDSILVMSDEPVIPWELVHLREPGKKGMPDETLFLGQMGLVRWLEGANDSGWPKESIKIRKEKARYVIPKYEKVKICSCLKQNWRKNFWNNNLAQLL